MGQNQPAATEVLEREPVFVDRTGRRRRLARNAGIAVGCLLAAYLAIVAFGLVSGADAPMTPWPAPKPSHRAVLPLQGRIAARQDTPRPEAKPTPSATVRSQRVHPTSSAPTTARTTAPAAPSTTQPGQGHAYGRTNSPTPKKP
jgi:hypothetical protein